MNQSTTVGRMTRVGLCALAFAAASLAGQPKRPLPGQIVVDPEHPQWLKRHRGGPFFMCGPGDPEGFLYRGKLRADGTRDGDQEKLIARLKPTGANCIYMMAVRSHGGDGGPTENPFIGHDPARGVNSRVLDQWERWFAEMDSAGIVIFLFLYDDSARPFGKGDRVPEAERRFIHALVNRLEHHKHLVWCIAEEYSEALSPRRASAIAAEIRQADDHPHPIAIHKHSGVRFEEFADDPNIDQFAIQLNVPTAERLHRGIVEAWRLARGRYNLNMSECASHGRGAEARKKSWAAAMGGACVMVLGMDIASTPVRDLEDCGRVVRFFERTNFNEMSPHDELAAGETEYVLARPGHSYIAYSSRSRKGLGIKALKPGRYDLLWFDCATGKEVEQKGRQVAGGDAVFRVPEGIGPEAALYLRRRPRR